jgi:hypothetical protein
MAFQHKPKHPGVVNPLAETGDGRRVKKIPSMGHRDATKPGL